MVSPKKRSPPKQSKTAGVISSCKIKLIKSSAQSPDKYEKQVTPFFQNTKAQQIEKQASDYQPVEAKEKINQKSIFEIELQSSAEKSKSPAKTKGLNKLATNGRRSTNDLKPDDQKDIKLPRLYLK